MRNGGQMRVYRSLLFVPAHQLRFINHAPACAADLVLLDLEDSVPAKEKPEARVLFKKNLEFLKAHESRVAVRINRPLDDCLLDLEAVVRKGVEALLLPKVLGPDHICLLDESIAKLEQKRGLLVGGIKVVAMIESLAALHRVDAIAAACPRLAALALGSEDLSLDGHFEPTSKNLWGPSQAIVFAARLAGVQAWGFPGSIANIDELENFALQLEQGKSMGFDGVMCIHPKQVEVVNRVYALTDIDILTARKIVHAYELAESKGQGAVEVDGKMVDLPVLERARRTLEMIA